MGSKKSAMLEKIKEGNDISSEAISEGTQMDSDGKEIKSLLEGIDTSMDEDDVSAIDGVEAGYSSDFKASFQENVETKGDQVNDIESEVSDESKSELGKVNDAAGNLEKAESISDIGKSNAASGADKMKDSAKEYEKNIEDSNAILQETKTAVDEMKSSIESIWGQ